nr:flagellar basal body rod protein FlgC [Ferroacidibacillus organovorans]
MFDGLTISATGLTANRLWLDVISNNIANANTTRTPSGGPYRREQVVLSSIPSSFQGVLGNAVNASMSGGGVMVQSIVKDPSPFRLVYDPTNPNAVNGYVQMPNVNIATEMVNMITASRAYEANVTAFDAAKAIDVQTLNIGK